MKQMVSTGDQFGHGSSFTSPLKKKNQNITNMILFFSVPSCAALNKILMA